MSPIMKMRLGKFKANKRGYYSLMILGLLFFTSLFAEFIANDKALIASYHGKYYFPIFKSYPETTFGGVFETEADYRDPAVIDLINSDGYLLMPPIPYGFNFSLGTGILEQPSGEHLLGTDDQGRDIVARMIYGFRLSILFGFALTISSSLIGIAIGAAQGYFGGWFDLLMQRFLEIWDSLPLLLSIIIISSVISPNLLSIFCIILAFSWMRLVNLVRAEFLRARNLDFVRAAQALGIREFTIICRHILPNALVSTFAVMPFILTSSVTLLAELDFLGFGLPANYPSLGELTLEGKNNLDSPWIGITAFISITIMLSLFIFIGEAFRDAFDPRKRLSSPLEGEPKLPLRNFGGGNNA